MCALYDRRKRETYFPNNFSWGWSQSTAAIHHTYCKRWEFYNGCICVVFVLVCVMAQHIHTLYYHRCTCVISVPLELCFHASVALIESNHGGRAPLWLKLVHDIVESVLVGSIDACFQERRGGCNRAQGTVCPSGGETHDPASAGVCPGRLTLICAPDQHVMLFVKLSEIYLERGNIFFAKCFSNQGRKYKGVQTHY